MRYIQIMPNSGAVQTALDQEELGKPYIAFVEDGRYIDWNSKSVIPPYSAQPLTFEIISGGTIYWQRYAGSSTHARSIEYSKDDGNTWTSITANTNNNAPQISVNSGDKVLFRGNNNNYYYSSTSNRFVSGQGCYFKAYGNIMSLINSTGFTEISELTSANTGVFRNLFNSCSGITSAEHLILPTNTVNSCYYAMFEYCSNLAKTPVLPANTLTVDCYKYLFQYDTLVAQITCLATGTITGTDSWTNLVSSTGTFTKHPNMSSWSLGKNGIPTGWTVVDAEL